MQRTIYSERVTIKFNAPWGLQLWLTSRPWTESTRVAYSSWLTPGLR